MGQILHYHHRRQTSADTLLSGKTFGVGGGGGLKELFKDDWLMDLIGDAGGGEENLQALPFLLQLFTDQQQGQEFDPSSYFQ